MLSPETTVAIVALVVAVPPAVAVIWRWYKSRSQGARTTSYRDGTLPWAWERWAIGQEGKPSNTYMYFYT